METYEIVMLAILAVLEVIAATVLTVGWIKAKKEERMEDNERKADRLVQASK